MEEDEGERLIPEPGTDLAKLLEYKVYRRRWFILVVICLLNSSNAMIWLSFAPVADQTAQYFNVTLDQINWLSLIYMVVAIPVSFGTTWMLDTLGLKTSLILSSWLNMTGSILRFISILSKYPTWLMFYPLLMFGQTLCALAQPLVIFSPTKMAALWFPEHQRATANMIASMSNPLGILFANILSPLIVKNESGLPLMLGIYAFPASIACLLATLFIRASAPPTPPSASAETSNSEPFLKGMKLDFAGLCGALFIVFGVVGAFLLGLFVDKTKKFTEVTKINMCLAALACIAFALVSQMKHQNFAIAAASSLFGFFGFSIYPVAMELSVECSYPIGEATSAGLIFISGQVQSIVYIILFQLMTKQMAEAPDVTCALGDNSLLSWRVPNMVMAAILSVGVCVFVVFFHTEYKRLKAEASVTQGADSKLNDDIDNVVETE
ncbi:solute carrier family 49 member A3 isoform X2 [Amia ocellicauda]|uniref:solute carrier family 49 member A3 isoform X2 n=1 Tax=Amia ocellicauda TaxID=2972642 RepID=UPI003463F6F6